MQSDTQLLGNHMSQNVPPGGQTADPSSEFIGLLGARETLTQLKLIDCDQGYTAQFVGIKMM